MKLTLGQHGYSWDYESATAPTVNGGPAWGSFSDTGSAQCRDRPRRVTIESPGEAGWFWPVRSIPSGSVSEELITHQGLRLGLLVTVMR